MTTPRLIATLKPLPDVMRRLDGALARGISCFRVNFGRRSDRQNLELLSEIRRTAHAHGTAAEIFVDLPGPKRRVGRFQGGSVVLEPGQEFHLHAEVRTLGGSRGVGIEDRTFIHALKADDLVVLADGRVVLRAVRCTPFRVTCVVQQGGRVHTRCGIVAPARYRPNLVLTSRDATVLRLSAPLVDHISLSFADAPSVIAEARALLTRPVPLVAKIESPTGLANLDRIAAEADALMLARGDLRMFYGNDGIRAAAAKLKIATTITSTRLIVATDYFRGVVETGALSREEIDEVSFALSMHPYGLVINESSYADRWDHVLDAAVQCLARFGGR